MTKIDFQARYFEDVDPADQFEEPSFPTLDAVIGWLTVDAPRRGWMDDEAERPELPASRFIDARLARDQGLPGAIVPGSMSMAILTRLVTDWMGPTGMLRSIEVDFRRLVLHEDNLRCIGLVTDTHEEEGAGLVKLDVYIENERGERPLQGTAVVELPHRAD